MFACRLGEGGLAVGRTIDLPLFACFDFAWPGYVICAASSAAVPSIWVSVLLMLPQQAPSLPTDALPLRRSGSAYQALTKYPIFIGIASPHKYIETCHSISLRPRPLAAKSAPDYLTQPALPQPSSSPRMLLLLSRASYGGLTVSLVQIYR